MSHIEYHIIFHGNQPKLLEKYFEGRAAAFDDVFPDGNNPYRNYPLNRDSRSNSVFLVVTNELNEVIGGASIYIKDVGDDYILPVLRFFDNEHEQITKTIFPEEYFGDDRPKYDSLYIAEIGGVFRNKAAKGLGINDGMYSRIYSALDEIGIDIVCASLNQFNKKGFPKGMIFNQEIWTGMEIDNIKTVNQNFGADRNLVVMYNDDLIKKMNGQEAMERMCAENYASPVSRMLDVKEISNAFTQKGNRK